MTCQRYLKCIFPFFRNLEIIRFVERWNIRLWMEFKMEFLKSMFQNMAMSNAGW